MRDQACQIQISEIRDFRKKIRILSGEKSGGFLLDIQELLHNS
jgi:hypothetical protein